MICKKCGSVATGKYCSNCGKKLLTPLEEYRRAEREVERRFKKICAQMSSDSFYGEQVASACWSASNRKYGKANFVTIYDPFPVDAYEALEEVERHAAMMFAQLKNI